ncbi:MAG: polymorphic rane protein [Phycisphaerales bacterium]|nr:polymorphic rane protein [Phycisphaerales bacterium]
MSRPHASHRVMNRRPGRADAARVRRGLGIERLESRTLLSVVGVTTTLDVVDGNTTSIANLLASRGADGKISLREAILAANNTAGANEVDLPAGTYTLTIAGHNDAGTAGQLVVNNALTLLGAGSAGTIIQAGTTATNGIDKVLSINPLGAHAGFAATLAGVTVRFGRNTASAASGDNVGGGIAFDAGPTGSGSLTMKDVVVSSNSTANGSGGGIYMADGGTVKFTSCQFTNNTANSTGGGGSGGGIYFDGGVSLAGTLLMTDSLVSGNNAADDGGGFWGTDDVPTISNCTVSNNKALEGQGGGIFDGTNSTGAGLTLTNSSVTGNSAADPLAFGFGQGGGIFVNGTGKYTIGSSATNGNIITGNSAVHGGGGIYLQGVAGIGLLSAADNRIVGNTSTSGGTAVDRSAGSFNAANNWWGTNTPPASLFGAVTTASPFLVMKFSSSKVSLNPGDTSNLTASVTTNSAAVGGFGIPDGTAATFACTLGTVMPTNTTTTAGSASSVYTPTPGMYGAAIVASTIDGQTLVIGITLNQPPSLVATIIGDGAAQRSLFKSFTLVFSQVVTLAPGAVTMNKVTTNSAGAILTSTPVPASAFTITNPSADGKTWVVQVVAGSVIGNAFGDFLDGVYQFTLHAALITNGTGATLAGGDQTKAFRKLFGDINGDGRVNSVDYFQFSNAFGSNSTNANFNKYFDYNHDNRINSVDYFQFGSNFGKALFLPV